MAPRLSRSGSCASRVSAWCALVACYACVAQAATVLRGCTYNVKGGETLAYLAASLNLNMDWWATSLREDLTNPGFFSGAKGRDLYIPCPGLTHLPFFPVSTAGCYFDYHIEDGITVRQLAQNPPPDIAGPLSITGLWTANWQSSRVDLTLPKQFIAGRVIQVPTCAHNSTIKPERIPHTQVTGCWIYLPNQIQNISPLPMKVSDLATLLRTTAQKLIELNPGKSLTADMVVLGLPSDSASPLPTVAVSLAFPCPTYTPE